MMFSGIFLIVFALPCFAFAQLDLRPIIGIVTETTNPNGTHPSQMFISSTYVKYLEMGGARVVPIMVNKPDAYYHDMFNSLNGVLFPGGGVSITTSGYARAGQFFYKLAKQAYDRGDYFPLWGTCLGFQLLTALTSGENLLTAFDSEDLTIPLTFTKGAKSSRLFADLPTKLYTVMSQENVTENYHSYGLSPEVYLNNSDLISFYTVLSTNVDRKGKQFISTIEAKKYPFYGTQWHPEKNVFKWNPKYDINHSLHAIQVTQYMANFFVSEARKNQHKFPSVEEEAAAVIENYQPEYSKDGSFEEIYYFPQ